MLITTTLETESPAPHKGLTEQQRLAKVDAIIAHAQAARKKHPVLGPHNYTSKGRGKNKSKRKSQHKGRARRAPAYRSNKCRPPNPYKAGSTYHRLWNDAFLSG